MRNNIQIVLLLVFSFLFFKNCASSNLIQSVYEEEFHIHHYSLHRTLKVTWVDAFTNCENENAKLLSIDSIDEFDFIRHFLNNSGEQQKLFWTSGSDIYRENNNIWMTNGKPIMDSLWGELQPNNYGGQHCVALDQIRGWDNFYLNDQKCLDRLFYICKRLLGDVLTQIKAEQQSLKVDIDDETNELNSLRAILIVIVVIVVLIAIIIVKAEVKAFLKSRQVKAIHKNDDGIRLHKLQVEEELFDF